MQGCGNTMLDLFDLVPFHSGQVEKFYLPVLGHVQMYSVSHIYAPAIRRMQKGIKRCPCPSVRPCVLPFVHHLGRYFVSATPPTIFSQSF